MSKGLRKSSLLGAAVLVISLLCGCSISGYENPESVSPEGQATITEDENAKTTRAADSERTTSPENTPSDPDGEYEIFVPDDPDVSREDQTKPGEWSATGAFDISGFFSLREDSSDKPVIVNAERLILEKFQSKTWILDIRGGKTEALWDTVVAEIINREGLKLRYISEDATDKVELANFSNTEGMMRVLSNLNPGHRYEITIINLETVPLEIEIKLSAYRSEEGAVCRN